ncbi:MAG: hypothetical protein J6C19_02945 [Lachnospiraceae bacterium]|nr:hypothetical protein [Lachnospiraceae bacterium]MBO5144478.1 hypothetical protein [Lachnospiraceae bacterium]
MSTEENYLDNLLEETAESKTAESMDEVQDDVTIEDIFGEEDTATPEESAVTENALEPVELPRVEGEVLEPEAAEELTIDEFLPDVNETAEAADVELPDAEIHAEPELKPDSEEPEFELGDMDIPEIPDEEPEFDLGDIDVSEIPDEELKFGLEDIDIPEIPDEEPELESGNMSKAADISDEPDILGNTGMKDGLSIDDDDSLDDVLSMLDDDAELAEINDMLKKSDNNEPIQDDMMDLLNQMADDEAASVHAGIEHGNEDNGGVPLPEMPKHLSGKGKTGAGIESGAGIDTGKKSRKASRKKKNASADSETENPKKVGKLGKFFNLLTEDLVPEPTEEELAAEKEAKEAKKQENLTKKEQDKLAREEAKKEKAEEKEASQKAKAELAAQKKKEKQAEKEKKLAAKKAKQEAEAPKNVKRIPPKKIAAVAVFGITVGTAVIVATNVLSTQSFLQSARNAYYQQDYKTVYQATYGMELDESKSDGLIKARSEVLLKLQRRYDSYQINLKMGREVEALDALLQGVAVYDYINADAEKYGVMEEADAIKTKILNTLEAKYGLDEEGARELINNDDALSYTIALNDIVSEIQQ